jgi:hypothetical protein
MQNFSQCEAPLETWKHEASIFIWFLGSVTLWLSKVPSSPCSLWCCADRYGGEGKGTLLALYFAQGQGYSDLIWLQEKPATLCSVALRHPPWLRVGMTWMNVPDTNTN